VDGRTAPVMNSVRQLVDVFPARCLVRKSFNAMTTDDVCGVNGTRSRRVSRGEVLALVYVTGQRLLQCRDEKGCDVYVPLNQRGHFSSINGHTAANVYTLRSLLAEYRLPIVVRMVYGSLPVRDATTGDLRLVGIQTDRFTFVLPLRHAWTSKSVDRRALVAVPSRHASRLTVAAAVRDFYYRWVMSDDGLELMRRCSEIVASWKASVHLVSSTFAASAAAAAAAAGSASVAVSHTHEGDDATWSRGPIGNSMDSGLASSPSLPSFVCTGDNNPQDDYVGHLEQEIDDIYAMIRYGADGVARQGRARSLDDCVSAGEIFSPKPLYRARRPSAADVLCASQMPPTMRRRERSKIINVTRLSSQDNGLARQSSLPSAQDDNVKLVGIYFPPENEMDDDENDVFLVGDNSQAVAISSGRLPESRAVVRGQPYCCITEGVCNCDERSSATPNPVNPRRRSKSLPEVTDLPQEPRRRKAHKSVIGTFTRSIANVFRRMRPHKVSHTLTNTGATTVASERYSRKTHDCSGT